MEELSGVSSNDLKWGHKPPSRKRSNDKQIPSLVPFACFSGTWAC